MTTLLRVFRKGVLVAVAIAIVTSTVYWPETRLLVVIWLLAVGVMWQPSPRRDG